MPQAVFVLREHYLPAGVEVGATGGREGCALCLFSVEQGCGAHKCLGGVWLDEVQAAVLRLEQ